VFQDVDDFFEHEKTFLLEYHNRVKDASAKCDRMIRSHKSKNKARKASRFGEVFPVVGEVSYDMFCSHINL